MTGQKPSPGMEELGYFGNIWVRQNYLPNKGDSIDGHSHYFDHITLLAHGSIIVEVENKESKTFTAPTFVMIKKEQRHKITALEDNTYYYCVFAVRDIDGNVEDIVNPENAPWFAAATPNNFWEKNDILKQATIKDWKM